MIVHPLIAALRQARIDRGISRRRLAEQLRYDHKTISYWENGHRHPRLDDLTRYAAAVGHDLILRPTPLEGSIWL